MLSRLVVNSSDPPTSASLVTGNTDMHHSYLPFLTVHGGSVSAVMLDVTYIAVALAHSLTGVDPRTELLYYMLKRLHSR
jgi:hypothetical protein